MTEKEYLCTWDGIFGRIISNEYKFTTNEKFELGFKYDSLYYEPEVDSKFKILNGDKIYLTIEEIEEIHKFCDSYSNEQDYEVQAYSSEDGIFEGVMLKSAAEKEGFKYRLTEVPDHPASKWIDEKGWVKIKASILESGHLVLDPPSMCQKCLIALTEDEWKTFPERKNPYYIWDFKESKWYDPRKIEDLKKSSQLEIRNAFEGVRWKVNGKFIPQFEQETWNEQLLEARSWLSDNNSETPYIDTFLVERTDELKPTKEELCNDIISNHNEYMKSMALVNAVQWGYLKRIDTAKTNEEVDLIKDEAIKDANTRIGR